MRFREERHPCRAREQRGPGRESSWWRLGLLFAASLGLMSAGCNSLPLSSSGSSSGNSPTSPNQLYFAPQMGAGALATYTIDYTGAGNYPEGTFVRTTYSAATTITSSTGTTTITGATITNAGNIDLSSSTSPTNGVLSLATTYIAGGGSIANPLIGSWAVQLPGQAALVELNTPGVDFFTPAVPTQSCPSLTTQQTFQFVTIPSQLSIKTSITSGTWNPQLETAYGSVAITTTGNTVQFGTLSQSTFPGTGGSLSFPGPATTTASCSTTFYGQTVAYPGSVTVTNPGSTTTPLQAASPSATIGIGPSGFLVEDSGWDAGGVDPETGLSYENLLGAGYGAIGLPKPTSDLTSSLVSGQFQGFLYAPGTEQSFSLASSFGGYSNQQASCATLISQLSQLPANQQPSAHTIYGGDFGSGQYGSNDPITNSLGNCDLAIDLGTPSANGLYTNATVYVGSAFPEYPKSISSGFNCVSASAYCFPAVAVAGQLQGKNAIFLLGVAATGSPNLAWGIYLLQSN
jgi:hypothetical protein